MTTDDYGRKYEHHALQAEAHLAANNGKPSPERVATAQVHATLAVAYASIHLHPEECLVCERPWHGEQCDQEPED